LRGLAHLTNPRAIVPQSVMPGYPFLSETEVDAAGMADHLRTNRVVGVPYTDDQIANAAADLKAQADPDNSGVAAFTKRYPKAVARNFDGKAGAPTEMDALIAYLQMLGTLVDFKLYNEKANLR
jgi:cytochrome c oxidase cbb3-type subunit II